MLIAHSAKTCQKYNVPSTMYHASSMYTIFDIINVEEQSVYNSARLDVVRNAQYWLVEMPYNDMGIDCSPPPNSLLVCITRHFGKKTDIPGSEVFTDGGDCIMC